MQVINRMVPSLFTNETRCRAYKHIHEAIVSVLSPTRFCGFNARDFLLEVDGSVEGLSECFRPISGMEIFQRGSVGAVSYNCTDDNKYRTRRAVKSNRLRL